MDDLVFTLALGYYHFPQVDRIAICGTDHKGNAVYLRVTRKQHNITEVWLNVQLDDGSVYQLPGVCLSVLKTGISYTKCSKQAPYK
jgi:selenocysteine lyase/cysteine desulfurase